MLTHSIKWPQVPLGKAWRKIYSMFLQQWYRLLPRVDLASPSIKGLWVSELTSENSEKLTLHCGDLSQIFSH